MIAQSVIDRLADEGAVEPEPEGSLLCLSVHRGDMKFSFSSDNPQEVVRAQVAVDDMLRKGYLLFVVDAAGVMHRVTAFDPKTNEYVIKIDMRKAGDKKQRKATTRVPAKKTRARAVAPTAGG